MNAGDLHAQVLAFLERVRLRAQNGLTVAEFGAAVADLLHLAVAGLDTVQALDGPAKKAWAVSAVGTLFDAVADRCVPLAARPVWWLVKPAVRAAVLAAAGGALEVILSLTRAATPAPEAPR